MTDASSPSRAHFTRARLLSAAVEAFAAKGFHATTTRDIAAAAGMSPAALYVHHKSKEDLLYLIVLTGHRRVLLGLRELIATIDDPVRLMSQAAYTFAAGQARDHTTARIISYELAALAPEHAAEIHVLRQQTDAEIRGIVERGVAAGVFHALDPAIAATALLSLSIDIPRWYHEQGQWTPEQIGSRYADLALRMLGAHAPDGRSAS